MGMTPETTASNIQTRVSASPKGQPPAWRSAATPLSAVRARRFEEYCAALAVPGAWCGSLELLAAARTFEIPILVITMPQMCCYSFNADWTLAVVSFVSEPPL